MPNKNQISWIALVAGLAIASTASARGEVDLTPCTGIAHPSQLTVECVDHLWKKAGCSTDIRLGHYRQYKSRKSSMEAVKADIKHWATSLRKRPTLTCDSPLQRGEVVIETNEETCADVEHPLQLTYECANKMWRDAGCSTLLRLGHYSHYKHRQNNLNDVEFYSNRL